MWQPINLSCESRVARISALVLPVASLLVLTLLVLRLHSIEIFAGSMLVVLGSAGAMIGLEGVQGTRGKWLRAGIVGVALAVGSYITSDGINRRQQYLSDRDALVSFSIERMFNQVSLDAGALAYRDYRTSGNLGFMFGYMPLHFSQAYLVVNSSTIIRHDPEFAKAMSEYIYFGELVASELRTLESLCSSLAARSNWTKEVIQEIFGEKGTLNDFLKRKQAIEGLITSRYEWSNKDVWNRLDEPFFSNVKMRFELWKRIQENSTLKPETGPKKPELQQ